MPGAEPGRPEAMMQSNTSAHAGLEIDEEITIAIMGATGSGKTTFINTISGSNLQVGNGLKSCTSAVERSCHFQLFGRNITLIDTPGFDDTTISDTDILKMIAAYLSTT
ncbi:hypothetical protein OBBRIDRAFT_892121 [Obba rivulosa]|uniref:G domain-containing protein n=1 Tax=Obba rivulosa TaxID=1052685 RepID=A0A8E2DDJ5_9APHY|nr:hypothetical protein OBBRIDRAFT_892121 [Obba rivulosa]